MSVCFVIINGVIFINATNFIILIILYNILQVGRNDGWLDVELGEYFKGVEFGDDDDVELEIHILDANGTKRGLIVDGIELIKTQNSKYYNYLLINTHKPRNLLFL